MAVFVSYGPEPLEYSDFTLARSVAVTVYEHGTLVKASLFDIDQSPIANPTATDELGNLFFLSFPGAYDVVGDGFEFDVYLPDFTGPPGESSNFSQNFAIADTEWEVVHNLGYAPAITLYDSLGGQIVGKVVQNDGERTIVNFAVPVAGRMTGS